MANLHEQWTFSLACASIKMWVSSSEYGWSRCKPALPQCSLHPQWLTCTKSQLLGLHALAHCCKHQWGSPGQWTFCPQGLACTSSKLLEGYMHGPWCRCRWFDPGWRAPACVTCLHNSTSGCIKTGAGLAPHQCSTIDSMTFDIRHVCWCWIAASQSCWLQISWTSTQQCSA